VSGSVRGAHEGAAHTVAESIDASGHRVQVRELGGTVRELAYDRLIVATGAAPAKPPIRGLDARSVFLLHTMADSFALHDHLASRSPKSAVIVGAGYIGLEMADALRHRGLEVTVFETVANVLQTVDPELGRRVQTERGALRVSRAMETGPPDVYAAGDCVETHHRLTEAATYLPLGTTSHKQGRVAGENAVGGNTRFEGSLGTQAVKVFDLVVGRTGFWDDEARRYGFDPLTTGTTAWDHKAYYPGATEIRLRVTGDRRTGRLLARRCSARTARRSRSASTSSRRRSSTACTSPTSSAWTSVTRRHSVALGTRFKRAAWTGWGRIRKENHEDRSVRVHPQRRAIADGGRLVQRAGRS
jgi:NADPH-dependent 2,4-dienoyl-CoA reductase/sulfur reductase-like enzyme